MSATKIPLILVTFVVGVALIFAVGIDLMLPMIEGESEENRPITTETNVTTPLADDFAELDIDDWYASEEPNDFAEPSRDDGQQESDGEGGSFASRPSGEGDRGRNPVQLHNPENANRNLADDISAALDR